MNKSIKIIWEAKSKEDSLNNGLATKSSKIAVKVIQPCCDKDKGIVGVAGKTPKEKATDPVEDGLFNKKGVTMKKATPVKKEEIKSLVKEANAELKRRFGEGKVKVNKEDPFKQKEECNNINEENDDNDGGIPNGNNNYKDGEKIIIDGITYEATSDSEVEVDVIARSVSKAIIPETITNGGKKYTVIGIGPYAASERWQLASVTFPPSIKYIESNAFHRCYALTTVTIPESVTYVASFAFSSCSSLTSVTINATLEDINHETFSDCSNLTSVKLPASLTGISYGAFRLCKNLTSITLPESLAVIQKEAFSNCKSLKSIIFPPSLKYIGTSAFQYCSSLESVTLPESLEIIGWTAFAACNITSIKLPTSLTRIGERVFSGNPCEKSAMEQIAKIQNTKDEKPSKKTTEDENDGEEITEEAFKKLNESLLGDDDDPGVVSKDGEGLAFKIDGILYYQRGEFDVVIVKAKQCQGSVTIPEYVTYQEKKYQVVTIGDRAFKDCEKLTSIKLPSSIFYIGKEAFKNCSRLTQVDLPSGADCAPGAFDGTPWKNTQNKNKTEAFRKLNDIINEVVTEKHKNFQKAKNILSNIKESKTAEQPKSNRQRIRKA